VGADYTEHNEELVIDQAGVVQEGIHYFLDVEFSVVIKQLGGITFRQELQLGTVLDW
jgi:hypothetical protein